MNMCFFRKCLIKVASSMLTGFSRLNYNVFSEKERQTVIEKNNSEEKKTQNNPKTEREMGGGGGC